jgi:predicted PurR-regulated permease PerM
MVYRWSVAAGFGLLTVYLIAIAVQAVSTVLVQAFVALFIAVSLDPAVRWMIRHGVRRGLAVTFVFLGVLAGLVGLIALLGPPLVEQGTRLATSFPQYIEDLSRETNFGDQFGLREKLQDLARTLPERIGANALAFVQTFLGALLAMITVIALTIYFMADLPRLRGGVARLFPASQRHRVRGTVDVVVDKVGAYMIGNLVISLFAGVASFIALALADVPYALALALVVAITDLIPLIGATLGAVICTVVAAVTTDFWPNTALVALFFLAYQQLENYVIAPRILRNAVDLSAVAVLMAGLVGASVLGLLGALMAIPIAAVIKVLGSPMLKTMHEPGGVDAAQVEEAASRTDDPPAGETPLERDVRIEAEAAGVPVAELAADRDLTVGDDAAAEPDEADQDRAKNVDGDGDRPR